jgi:hypothetical protein
LEKTDAIITQPFNQQLSAKKNALIFSGLWLLTFLLYLPAAKAGWVYDSEGWLYNIKNLKFWNYINNSQSGIPSLYQFTQLTTYIFYKLFKANPYAWHTLMVTMHATNCFLLFIISNRLFQDSKIKSGCSISLAGVALYTVCPHVSEVIVWESAFHYLQGFLLIFSILYLVQLFHHRQHNKYAWLAAITYFCSTYSLEIFYLTPWFVLTLALYYRYALGYDQALFKNVVRSFFMPLLCLFAFHIVVLLMVYGANFAHIGGNVLQPFTSYICKPPRYIFHILFLGRYFPLEVRRQVYLAVGSNAGLIVFYNIFILVGCYIVSHFTRMTIKARACVLFLAWIIIAQAIIMPLAFPDMQLVYYDRYTYFLTPFVYMLLALLVSYISIKYVCTAIIGVYVLANVYFTTKVNMLWKQSSYIVNRLLKDFPDPGDKTVILLNLPQNLSGVPMIYANKEGEFNMMYQLFTNKNVPNKIYDAVAYNMLTKDDGAHVWVHNDSLIKVTLNQWGTWWWYQDHGAVSYENEDYKLDMKDMGHWYDLKLKHPASQYLILFNQGDQWKIVNMNKRGEDQY